MPVVELFGSKTTTPLATLRRHSTTVVLEYAVTRTNEPEEQDEDEQQDNPSKRMEFPEHSDAVFFLRFWKSDAGAMASLRSALARYRQGPVTRLSDDQVIDVLADHLSHGELVCVSSGTRARPSDTAPLTGTAAAAAPAAAAPADVVAAPASILPQLETVQIEGAQVLPEVLQTMEQLELTMGTVEVATVSLEPTPSGVSAINTELTTASSSITTTLDDL